MEEESRLTQSEESQYPSVEQYKRHIAFKFRIGAILSGTPMLENERLKFLEIANKRVSRVNIIANVVDKYIQEGEKKFASVTLDDATGQIKLKTFGEDIIKLTNYQQGDTLLVIGLLRSWKDEIYITPEIIKKKDSSYLIVRKLESELNEPKALPREQLLQLKDKILMRIKEEDNNGGLDIDSLIMELKEKPDIINNEIKKLIEDGMAYEPRPGKLRYLG